MNTEKTYFARRCDVTGQGINAGLMWRGLGRLTAVGEASDATAKRLGFKDAKDAQKAGVAVFKAWVEPEDVRYTTNESGQLCDLQGAPVGKRAATGDDVEEWARMVSFALSPEYANTLARALEFGAAVMRERSKIATNGRRAYYENEATRALHLSGRLAANISIQTELDEEL